jgi:hypothetical protein
MGVIIFAGLRSLFTEDLQVYVSRKKETDLLSSRRSRHLISWAPRGQSPPDTTTVRKNKASMTGSLVRTIPNSMQLSNVCSIGRCGGRRAVTVGLEGLPSGCRWGNAAGV